MRTSQSLTLKDALTGATAEVPITGACIPSLAFAKLNPIPIRVYDPGYKNTTVCRTKVSRIDPPNGKLFYRGYDIETLVEESSFLEVAYLLIYGELPTSDQLRNWEYQVMHHTYIHVELETQMSTFRYNANPMGILIATVASLSTFHPEANPALQGDIYSLPKNCTQSDRDRVWANRNRAIYRMLGKIPTIAANSYRHRIGRRYNEPMPNAPDYASNVFFMIQKLNIMDYKPDPKLSSVFNKLFILLAEHGSNCSTVTMRHLVSSGVDPYSALAGAFAALFGERKCHAVIDMLEQIKSIENIPLYLSNVKRKSSAGTSLFSSGTNVHSDSSIPLRLQGFGHRVYKGGRDPRVAIARKLAFEAMDIYGGPSDLAKLAIELELSVEQDEYFSLRKIYANIDYWTAILLHACNFPKDMFPVWLAIPRVAGLISHWIEAIDDPEYKIFRPRQIYTGNQGLSVVEALSRTSSVGVDLDTAYVGSDQNAAKRRNQDERKHTIEEIERMIKESEDSGGSWRNWLGKLLLGYQSEDQFLKLLVSQKNLLQENDQASSNCQKEEL